jgi:hypothetical protein
MLIRTVPAAYTNGAGAHVLLTTESSGICPNGVPTVMPGGQKGRVLMSVLIPPGSPPVPTVEWCAAMTASPGTSSAPTPIVTTSDDQNDPLIWTMNGGVLMGYDAGSGATVFTSADTCPNIHPWTSPIAVKGRIVAAGDGNFCSWSPH